LNVIRLWSTVSDFFQLDDLLSSEDVALCERIRSVIEKHVAQVVDLDLYWAGFPWRLRAEEELPEVGLQSSSEC
ncbi:hypothetical protein M758_UG094200, partial [Ceratodon purpureus]